jgi:hypothetical protein
MIQPIELSDDTRVHVCVLMSQINENRLGSGLDQNSVSSIAANGVRSGRGQKQAKTAPEDR